ncbi:PAS domain S-box protein [Methanoregula formicica]|uniref:PAS domain S-box n=1 Tax=Methanoregula formicica (strain DSM 22288 / NBRC 105244 / SMSP) TaxID=593750 RepID=L0HI73_METFS|nr:PAS domain S-box protein [Methanoregula formicica]AGB02769.1 PAS domain S-box [Methanoregula formicica SMSP]
MPGKKAGLTDRTPDGSVQDIFRTIFERIQTAILIVDPAAHEIVDANPLMESLTGLTKDQMLGKGCQGFVCPAKCGECPVTDLHKNILNIEREVINAKGERVPVLKTVAKADFGGKEYLVESYVDITSHKKAEERQAALLAYLSESILRAKKPLELMQNDFQDIVKKAESGDYDAEDIRMQLALHAKNLAQIVKNLEELQAKALKGKSAEIPPEFREFLLRK